MDGWGVLGGGGGGRLIPAFMSTPEATAGASDIRGGVNFPSETSRGLGLDGPGDREPRKLFPEGVEGFSTPSCSNLDLKLLTAGGGIGSKSFSEPGEGFMSGTFDTRCSGLMLIARQGGQSTTGDQINC